MIAATAAHAQRGLKDIPDPSPAVEQASFKVHPGFEVNLYASDPMIAKPIQINFDAKGRLWVASSSVYPHIKPGQQAEDKIIVLEDTDGDGKADKSTVFAEGLLIPTAVEPHDTDGPAAAFVANSTEMIYLVDSDGDGNADKEQVVLSGFGTEDTHHILHTFRWGVDGSLYMNQSIYIHSHIETPHGVRRLNGGGIWRFRPRTLDLGVYVYGFVNTWGHHWNDWGAQFATDGAYGDGPNYTFSGAMYVTAVGAPRVLQGLAPGNPKHCGLLITSGRHLPEDWRDSVITNDFRGNRINRFTLSEDGSGYAARKEADVLASSSVAFRPIDVKMGPDGAIYVADWYNPIIQHGEVDFRDDRRDHVHGRIWRITAKDRPLVTPPKLVGASNEELLDALKAPEEWTRNRAKRLLVSRGKEKVQPALAAWVDALDTSDPRFEHHRLEALWLYQGLDVVEPKLLATLLRSKEPNARASAMRVLFYWLPEVPEAMPLLAAGVRDDYARVRLEAVRVLGEVPSAEAAALALEVLDKPMDRFLEFGLWLTMRELQPQWLPQVQAGTLNFDGNADRLTFALNAVGESGGKALAPLMQQVRDGKIEAGRRPAVLQLIATLGGPNELAFVFERTLDAQLPASERAALLTSLVDASQQRKVRPSGDLKRLGELLDDKAVDLAAAAARATGAWRIEPLRPKLVAMITPQTDWRARQAAFDAIAQLGGPESRKTLDQFVADKQSPWVRMEASVALAAVDLNAGASAAAAVLGDLPATIDPSGMLRPILNRKGGAEAIAKALTDREVNADVAKLAMRAVSSSAQQSPALLDALRKSGGLTESKRELTPAEMEAMLAEVQSKGDPARGEKIFRRADLGCVKCHAIGGAGGLVGPDIASLGASAPVDYIVQSLYDPNAKVKENYHLTIVETNDGRQVPGVLSRKTDKALLLRDAADAELTIPLSDVASVRTATGQSLMPAGLTDAMTHSELVDVIAFMSKLGKPGAYNVGQARVVRTWKSLLRTAESQDRLRHQGIDKAAIDDPAFQWFSVYSTVDGALPLEDAPPVQVYHGGGNVQSHYRVLRATIDVTTPGKVGLALNDAAGLQMWRGKDAIAVSPRVVIDLPKGPHTLTFAVDPARKAPLRLEIVDVDGSEAKAAVVNGK